MVERMVRWSEDLATRGGKRRSMGIDPSVGTPLMVVKKFCRRPELFAASGADGRARPDQHAQIEERWLMIVVIIVIMKVVLIGLPGDDIEEAFARSAAGQRSTA